MRFMKSMMAMAALCAAVLTMMSVMRKRSNGMPSGMRNGMGMRGGMRKRHGRWAGHN